MSDADAADGDPVAALEAAAADLATARERIDDSETVAAVADLHADLLGLLDRYEGRATDWDDLEGYAEFRTELGERTDDLDDHPEAVREAVDAADEAVLAGGVADTLSTADFRAAREALSPLAEYVERRDDLEAARRRYRDERRAVADRRDAVADRVAELEAAASFADADAGADLDGLRRPVEAYNRAVADDVEALVAETDAETALGALAGAARRPLVEATPPPEDLHEFVRETPAGEKPLATLAEWATYDPSKLARHTDDAERFRRHVATRRSYIEAVDATPFEVAWPPPPADELRWRCRELEPAVRRFAREETVARLRAVRRLPRRVDYAGLRRAAVARERLDTETRRRLEEGTVEEELAAERARLDRLESALEEHPPAGGS